MAIDHELTAALIALDAPSMRTRTMPLLDVERREMDIYEADRLRGVLSSGETALLDVARRRDECGTTCCLAGHVLLAAGAMLTKKLPDWDLTILTIFRTPDGHYLRPDAVGQLLLGLDDDAADAVFYGCANEGDDMDAVLGELRRVAPELCAEAGL